MKLNEILKSVALQSGVAETELTSILGNTALASIEVDDAISTKLTAPRLSMDAAKSNPDLKKHFTAQALNGVDAEILRSIQEHELDDDAKTEIVAGETTFKKIPILLKKLKEAETKKAAGTGDGKKLNEQITSLNGEIAKIKSDWAIEKKSLVDGFEAERIDNELNSLIGTYNFALPKDTPKKSVIDFGRSLVNTAFAEKGVKIVKENGALVLKTNDGTDHFENNVKVGLGDFVSKTYANAKVLNASGKQEPATPGKVHTQGGGQPDLNTGDFMSVMDNAISEVGQK